jgi:diaminopimelate epimerase
MIPFLKDAMLSRNQFVRSHGLGNDYLVMDPSVLSFTLTPETVRLICDRHTGVGSDGILIYQPPPSSDFEASLRIFNPDGSEAEKSGNGLRIFCKFAYEHGYTKKSEFGVNTAGGPVRAILHLENSRAGWITVEMGSATFDAAKIPVMGFTGEVVSKDLVVTAGAETKTLKVTCVSVGNPHCVVFLDNLDDLDIRVWGPALENHPSFPNRSNVQFAKPLNDKEVDIRIWERGAGYTMASGSSSCAVASACVKNGRTKGDLTIHMPGGDLSIKVDKSYRLTMRGPAAEVCVGVLSGELLTALEKAAPRKA